MSNLRQICSNSGPGRTTLPEQVNTVEHSSKTIFQRLRESDPEAATVIFEKYSQRLCALVSGKIGRQLQQRLDPEDVVQSVFRSFFRRSMDGDYEIDHSGRLWSLLASIAANKVLKKFEFHSQACRSMDAETSRRSSSFSPLLIDQQPSTEEVNSVTETLGWLNEKLDADERIIFNLRISKPLTTAQIGERVGVSRWTVRRILKRIEELLEDRMNEAVDRHGENF